MPSFRTLNFDKENNEVELRLNLDLLDEKRERAEIQQPTYKHQIAKYYNWKGCQGYRLGTCWLEDMGEKALPHP